MPRQKGTPKTGGRTAGTPNKTTAAVKECLARIITKYVEPAKRGKLSQLEEDMQQMTPKERAAVIAQLVGYVIPKQQAVSIDEQQAAETEALKQLLQTAPEEAITAISHKILELQAANRKQTA